MKSKSLSALIFTCSALISAQTLSLRDEISPQALKLAKADYATMSATPSAHASQIPSENDDEQNSSPSPNPKSTPKANASPRKAPPRTI